MNKNTLNISTIILDNMYEPSSDIYHHVNNSWIKKTKIPDDEASWGVFGELREYMLETINDMMLQNKNTVNPNYMKVITLYNMMNLGNDITIPSEVKDIITTIMGATDIIELRKIIIDLFTINGITSANNFYVSNDLNDSSMNMLHIGTGGLGLPDRDYYFNKMDESKMIVVAKYKEFMKKYLDLFKDLKCFDPNIVETIYNIEEQLAKCTYTNVMKRDSTITNHPYTISQLQSMEQYKLLADDLMYFFSKMDSNCNRVNITNPAFTEDYYKLLYRTDIKSLKQYFIYLFLRKMGNYINNNSEMLLFDFYGKILSGTKEIQPLWKRTIHRLDTLVGMLVGEMYVEMNKDKYNVIKKQVENMIHFMKEELHIRLNDNTWMEEKTKIKAIEKLDKMNYKIGFPCKWKSFNELRVNKNNSYFKNIMACYVFDYNEEYLENNKKIDRNKWFMNPQDINAYYSPSYNEIVFPLGILQPPFFDVMKDMEFNFGGIGCIIGHEITHGFDDMGRKFDADGNLKDWWTPTDTIKYKIQTDKLKKYFSKLKIEDHYINGELTLGENIADLGGVEISFNALIRYNKKHKNEKSKEYNIKNFFYNYANCWKYKTRPEEIKRRLNSDPHSPPMFRVNAILPHVNSFYKIFKLSETSPLYINMTERVKIF
jgi:putative endopeptidase